MQHAFETLLRLTTNPAMSAQKPASLNEGSKQPEYTKYKSMRHFFNHHRAELLKTAPSHHQFRQRIKQGTRGHLVFPFPQGQPRRIYPPHEIVTEKRRRIKKQYLTSFNPGWCLRRWQLMEMWNKDVHTVRQWKDKVRAEPKMQALANEFRLRRYFNR